jgi:hypothetical protein
VDDKAPGIEANHSRPPNVEFKNQWNCTYITRSISVARESIRKSQRTKRGLLSALTELGDPQEVPLQRSSVYFSILLLGKYLKQKVDLVNFA